MSSPDVWDSARAILEAGSIGVPIAWPNEAFTPPTDPALWVAVEVEGETSTPVEIGARGVWEEEGRLWCHVMVPTGSGLRDALVLRKTIMNLFRGLDPAPVVWYGAQLDPLGAASEDGSYQILSLALRYRYQDTTATAE